MEVGCRDADMEAWKALENLEVRCRCSGVDVCSLGGIEVWRPAAGVATGRYGCMEL